MTQVAKHLFCKNQFQKFHSGLCTHVNQGGILSTQWPCYHPETFLGQTSLAVRKTLLWYMTFSVFWTFSALLTFPGLYGEVRLVTIPSCHVW